MGELIFKRLRGIEDLPRIYYGKAGYDEDENYPYIILSVEREADAYHDVIGTLTIDIICAENSELPEPIEKKIRRQLENVFFHGDEIFILVWQKSEAFQERSSESTPLIIGMTLFFEIRELPSGLTAAPDAIQALQLWAEKWNSDAVIIGLTDFGEIFEPRADKPALYISQTGLKLERQVSVTAFVEADIKFHLFAPKIAIRRQWLMSLYHALLFAKAIPLGDGSPMRLQSGSLDFTADQLQGQLKTTWEYGILERELYAHPLNHLEMEHTGGVRDYTKYLRRD